MTVDDRIDNEGLHVQAFDSKGFCIELIDGKIMAIDYEGKGEPLLFAGTDYDIGGRWIEIIHHGITVLEVGESCAWPAYPESDARDFAALYERLAKQTRAFQPKRKANRSKAKGNPVGKTPANVKYGPYAGH